MALDNIEPWSDRRIDIWYAAVIAALVNTSINAPKEKVSPAAFIPDWWKVVRDFIEQQEAASDIERADAEALFAPDEVEVEQQSQDIDEFWAKIVLANKALGGSEVTEETDSA